MHPLPENTVLGKTKELSLLYWSEFLEGDVISLTFWPYQHESEYVDPRVARITEVTGRDPILHGLTPKWIFQPNEMAFSIQCFELLVLEMQ